MHWGGDDATAVDIEVYPQRGCFGRREPDFALQDLVKCRAAKTEIFRVVLRLHSCGSEVHFGLPVGL